jgi:hypothetical protein
MKLTTLASCSLGLLVATTTSLAQGETKKAQEPTTPKEAAVKTEPGTQLNFNVSGLTKDNITKVKESLTTITSQTYVCEPCHVEQAMAGKCPACQADLASKKRPVFQTVTPSAEDSSVKVTLDPATMVRLSELERALAANSVKIDPAKFPISGKAHLVFKGATADQVPAIEKALKDAKLFDEVSVMHDAKMNEVHAVVRAGAMAPTRAKLATALETGGVKTPVSDIIWGPMPKTTG